MLDLRMYDKFVLDLSFVPFFDIYYTGRDA
jgi:hypothetical protein